MRRTLSQVTRQVLLLLLALVVTGLEALRLPSSSSTSSSTSRSRTTTALFQFLYPPTTPTHSPSCSCCSSSIRPPPSSHHAHTSPSSQPRSTRLYISPPEYDMIHVAGDVVAGFVGGAVGVMGTIMALEVKMRQVNERSKCPYCSGSGQLTCARCYGQQTVSYKTPSGRVEERPCPGCLGVGTVVCINCKGDGLAIPVMLDKKVSRDPETRLEEYGMG